MDYQEKYEALKKAYIELEKAFDEYKLKVAKITFAVFDDVQEEKHGTTLRDVYEQLGIEVNEFEHPEVNFDEVLWENKDETTGITEFRDRNGQLILAQCEDDIK